MISRTRLWALCWLGAAITALVLLAASISGVVLRGGRALPLDILLAQLMTPAPIGAGRSEPLGIWAAFLFWGLIGFSVIAMIFSPQLRKRVLRMLPVYIGTALLLYFLLRYLQYLASQGERQGEQRQPPQPGELQPPADLQQPTFPTFVADPPQWLLLIIGALVVGLVLALVWFMLQRRPRAANSTPLEGLVEEAEQALASMERGSDVRETVLRCYQEMNRALHAERGVQRRAAATAREFEQLLTRSGMQNTHIHRLTTLFERVRYGGKAANARDEQEAKACLTAIVETYRKRA